MNAMIVPKGWKIKRLGELVDIVGGGTPARDVEAYWKKGSIPWVTVKDLHHKLEISDSEERITEFGLKNSAANLIPPQNIITPTRMSLGRFFINSVPITINQDLKALKPKKDIFPLFLLWNLLQYGTKLEALGTGTTVKGITLPDLKNLQLLVPSFLEQQKIATILSTLDRTIEATQKLIDKEKMVKKGLMADLLTHGIDEQGRIRSPQTHTYVNSLLGMIPEGWEVKAIVNISKTFAGGTPDRGTESYYTGHIPWVKSGEVNQNKIYDTEEKITEEALKNSNTKLIKKDTILVAMYGATAGQIAYLKIDACSNQAVLAIPINSDCNDFVFYALSYAMPKLLFQAQGSGQPNLSKQLVDRTLLGMPLSYEQQKIAAILSAQDRKIETEETNLDKLQNLKKGLMEDLLSGKVRVKV